MNYLMTIDDWRVLFQPGILACLPDTFSGSCELVERDGALVVIHDGGEEEFLPSGFLDDPKITLMAWGAQAMKNVANKVANR